MEWQSSRNLDILNGNDFLLYEKDFKCNLKDFNQRVQYTEQYVLERLAALRRAELDAPIDHFLIWNFWLGNPRNRFVITPTIASAIVEVFRYYRQRGHVWDFLDLNCCVHDDLRCVLREAKSLGMFTAIGIDHDFRMGDVNGMLIREATVMNPSLKQLQIFIDSEEVYQTLRDCLTTTNDTTASKSATKLTHLTLLCSSYDHLSILAEGLLENDSLQSLVFHSYFEEYLDPDDSLIGLIAALPSSLKVFKLGHFKVTLPVQRALEKRLSDSDCHISELSLGDDTASPDVDSSIEMEPFAHALKQNTSLTKLELWHYHVTSNDVLSLLNALPDCPTLKTLCLERAGISKLDFTQSSILPSSNIERVELSLDVPTMRDGTTQEVLRTTRDSLALMLTAIPSLGSIGCHTVYNWPESALYSADAAFLLDYNRITRGRLTPKKCSSSLPIPLSLWEKIISKVEKQVKPFQRDARLKRNCSLSNSELQKEVKARQVRCKASVIFCLLRSYSPEELAMSLRLERHPRD